MTPSNILRAKDFEAVAEVHADNKRRIVLKRVKNAGKTYRVWENSLGQIILDPMVSIPASEAWLFQNKDAIGAVRKGLKESAEGRLVKLPSLSRHANEDAG